MAAAKTDRSSSRRRASKAVTDLVTVAHAVGGDPQWVQGSGGNVSVKDSRNGMCVTASGAILAEVMSECGWVTLDLNASRALLDDDSLLDLDPLDREARVRRGLQNCVRGAGSDVPSVESLLHALLGRVVVHIHPVGCLALLCSRESRSLWEDVFGPLARATAIVEYCDPGFMLARRAREVLRAYEAANDRLPSVVCLENHGVFVSADDAGACLKQLRRVVRAGERWAGRVKGAARRSGGRSPRGRMATSSNGASVREPQSSSTAELRGALLRAGCAPGVVQVDASDVAGAFVSAAECAELARRGAVTPDQVVFCGEKPVVLGAKISAWERTVALHRERLGADPRVVVRPGHSVSYVAPDLARLRGTAEVYRAAMAAMLQSAGGGPRFLKAKERQYLLAWKANVLDLPVAPAGKLCGRIAAVTGAASGLGKGIARGIVEAGATVAGFDVNADALESTAAEFPSGRFIPIAVDVTSEDSVASGLRALEATAGGLDFLVNAAGIAPSFGLADFPLGAWQKTLDINLTGYFLCAREAVRVLLRQNSGGSIVNLTSKSGLDASKANSAYNATKAGEIHLMRGWALELGGARVRVNCVAPGNVFKGSQIWNDEYIRACARKKGIRPEEVIPYYTSLTPLGQEIEPQDIADGVVFLLSDAARNVTGQTLVIDGGQVMVR